MFELIGTEVLGTRKPPEKVVYEAAQKCFLVLENAGGPWEPQRVCVCVCFVQSWLTEKLDHIIDFNY